MLGYIVRRVLATIPVMAIVALFVFSLLYIAPGDPAAVIAGDQAIARGRRAHPQEPRSRPAVPRALRRMVLAASCRATSARRSSPACRSPTLIAPARRADPVADGGHPHPRGRRSPCRWAWWRRGRPAPGSTALDGASRCSASRCRCSSSAICSPTSSPSSSTGCRCRATRRSPAGFWPWLENLILPSIALGCVYIALIARITRATMLEVLQQDYIRTARAKGMGAGAASCSCTR